MSYNKSKFLWSSLKHNHLLLMLVGCLVPVGLIIGWQYLSGGGGGTWLWLVLLLCPLMHVWLMRNHNHEGRAENKTTELAAEEKQRDKLPGG